MGASITAHFSPPPGPVLTGFSALIPYRFNQFRFWLQMARFRRRFQRRRGQRKRRFNSRGKRLPPHKPEVKAHETVFSETLVDIAGSAVFTNLVQIAQGLDTFNRVGRVIQPFKLSAKFNLRWDPLETSFDDAIVRCMVILDKRQTSDTAPLLSEVIDDVTTTGFINREVSHSRFRVLFDRRYIIARVVPQKTKLISINIKRSMIPKKIFFNSTGTGDIEGNGLWLIFFTDQAFTANEDPLLCGTVRLYYTDS